MTTGNLFLHRILCVAFVDWSMGDASDCFQNVVSASSCAVCAQHGRQSKLYLCRLSSEEAVFICSFPEVSFCVMHCMLYFPILFCDSRLYTIRCHGSHDEQ